MATQVEQAGGLGQEKLGVTMYKENARHLWRIAMPMAAGMTRALCQQRESRPEPLAGEYQSVQYPCGRRGLF